MSSWARVGVKCVCVDADSGRGNWGRDSPIENGKIYTVKDVFVNSGTGLLNLVLRELGERKFSSMEYGYRCGYAAYRFRPLISQADDVAMFREIADGAYIQGMVDADLIDLATFKAMTPSERLDRVREGVERQIDEWLDTTTS